MEIIFDQLTEQPAYESAPIFDRLMDDVGSLFDEFPWPEGIEEFEAWDLPADYELPPLPMHLAIERTKRHISASFDTQMMEVIS